MNTPLMVLTGLLAGAGATPAQLQPMIEKALQGALQAAGARVEARGTRLRLPRGCVVVEARADTPVRTSARIPLSLTGMSADGGTCRGLAWVDARVLMPVPVTTAPVLAGMPLDAHVATAWREVRPGEQPWMKPTGDVTFATPLPRGAVVQERNVQPNIPKAGSVVDVVVRNGAVMLSAKGRMVNCGQRRACAQLGTGRQVEGSLVNGTLVVEAL